MSSSRVSINSFGLKIIAMLTMVIDHVGVFLISNPEIQYIFRCIGRLSFPIYAFLLVEGVLKSRNNILYLLRLLIFGIIVNGFIFAFAPYYGTPDSVLISLSVSGFIIYFLEFKKGYFKLLSLIPLLFMTLCDFSFFPFKAQYGLYGALTVLIIYISRFIALFVTKKYSQIYQIDSVKLNESYSTLRLSRIISLCIFIVFTLITAFFNNHIILIFDANLMNFNIQAYSIISFVILIFYNEQRGYNKPWFKWGCYLFYPVHMLIILLIQYFIA